MAPLVSVVVPVHNGERFLAATLESALSQDHEPVEVIVVDDGSTDRSAEIAAGYPVTLIRQENQGVAAARNAGVEAARGEILAFLDADDLWRPDKLTRQVAALTADPALGYVLSRIEVLIEPGTPLPYWLSEEAAGGPLELPIPSTLAVRRSAFEAVGPLDPSFRIASDGDWIKRARDAGIRWERVPEVLVRYRVHGSNDTDDRGAVMGELARLLQASVRRRPLVSVVIPVRNSEEFLGAAIESVLAQTYEPVEIIVVDNASTDGSGEVAQRYDVRYIRHDEDLGQSVNRNSGIELARGELIGFCDSDDLWLPEKLTLQVAYLRARPELDYVMCTMKAVLEPGVEAPGWLDPSWQTEGLAGILPGAVLAHRRAFERIGGFDPSFEITADTDWFMRSVDAGLRHAVMPQILYHWRIHGENTSYRRQELKSDLMRLLRASVLRKRAMAPGDR